MRAFCECNLNVRPSRSSRRSYRGGIEFGVVLDLRAQAPVVLHGEILDIPLLEAISSQAGYPGGTFRAGRHRIFDHLRPPAFDLPVKDADPILW
jgi:hypothetical protein